MQLVQEKMMSNRRSSSVSTVLNTNLVWKLLVYRIVDLQINLGIYFCTFIGSKNILKPCLFLNKQEYFLPKKKHIPPSIFVNCVLYLSASSRFPRSYSTRLLRTSKMPIKCPKCNPFSYTLKTVLFLKRNKLWHLNAIVVTVNWRVVSDGIIWMLVFLCEVDISIKMSVSNSFDAEASRRHFTRLPEVIVLYVEKKLMRRRGENLYLWI